MKFKLTLVSLSFVLGGCTSETESDLLKTKAIQAQYLISSNGERTKINAELNSGGSFGSNIRLSNGDKLFAETLGKRITLSEDSDILDIDYEGRFGITSGNTNFQIDLVRNGEQNAQSNVDLPLKFTILEPSNNATINYNQTVTVQLDGLDPVSQTELILNYGCDDSNGGVFSGSASYPISNVYNFNFNLANKNIIDIDSSKQYKNCELDIVIERFREGEISSELADTSFIRGIQTRKIEDLKITF